MPAEFDDLSRRLADLESDVNRVHMAGPAAARRRGRQRTRNRAIAVTVGTLAAAAVGVGVINALPSPTANVEPIDTPSPAPDDNPTPQPDDTTPSPDASTLSDLLLETDDLASLGWPWLDLDWTEDAGEPLLGCFPSDPGGIQSARITFTSARTIDEPGDFPVWADERIYTFGSEAEAGEALKAIRDELGLCATDRDDIELTTTWEYDGLGDAAFQSEVLPPDDEFDAFQVAAGVGAARTGSTLVVTVTHLFMPGEGGGSADLLAGAVSKVCGGECVGEITQRQTYPASSSPADVPFLLDEEVNPVGSYADFVRADTVEDPTRYVSFCLPELVYPDAEGQPSAEPVQVGGEAPTIYQAVWFGPSEGSVYQTVMHFLDAQEAADFVADYSVLPDECGEVIDTHEQVVNQPVSAEVSGADEAIVWSIEESVLPTDPGSEGGYFGVGMARSDNTVVVIGFSAMGDPMTGTGSTWSDYAASTLELAFSHIE